MGQVQALWAERCGQVQQRLAQARARLREPSRRFSQMLAGEMGVGQPGMPAPIPSTVMATEVAAGPEVSVQSGWAPPTGAYAGYPSGAAAGRGDYGQEIQAAAGRYGLDPDLIRAVIQAESSFRADAVSPSGAQGLMQLMPGTARYLGVEDAFDPGQNILGGARYLRELTDQLGDVRLAVAAYNCGPGRIAGLNITDAGDFEQYRRIPASVRSYLEKVMGYYEQYRDGEQSQALGGSDI